MLTLERDPKNDTAGLWGGTVRGVLTQEKRVCFFVAEGKSAVPHLKI